MTAISILGKPKVIKVKAKKSTSSGCNYITSSGMVYEYFLYIMADTIMTQPELDLITEITLEYEYATEPSATELNQSLVFTNIESSSIDDYNFSLKVSLPQSDVERFRENSPRLCQMKFKYGTSYDGLMITFFVNDF